MLNEGFENITVLDISAKALEKAKQRLGNKAKKVNWIVSNITALQPNTLFDVWHDRATFHFLTSESDIDKYLFIAKHAIKKNGNLIIGTFSENGPEKCSGLQIKQYSESSMSSTFKNDFDKIKCVTENHVTPFNTIQNFLFCSFKRKQ